MNAVAETRPKTEVAVVRQQLDAMEGQFKAALPAHIPAERFARVVMTAIQNNPDLLQCERRSLWNAAMKAAQDGLLPDGREAALVVYRDKSRGKIAQYMPMIAGLRKKVRNSGEIATWDAQVVHENDAFEYELGDDPYIRHRPALGEDRGKPIAAYSIATLKSGEKSREVMSIGEIEAIRKRSRASGNGPWVTDYAEMCRKTVARRHAKVLPMSTDLDDLIRRDDDLYDMKGAQEEAKATSGRSLGARLDTLASLPQGEAGLADTSDEIDADTGEIIDAEAGEDPAGQDDEPRDSRADAADPDEASTVSGEVDVDDSPEAARARGVEARKAGKSRKAVPGPYREDEALAAAWLEGFDGDMEGD